MQFPKTLAAIVASVGLISSGIAAPADKAVVSGKPSGPVAELFYNGDDNCSGSPGGNLTLDSNPKCVAISPSGQGSFRLLDNICTVTVYGDKYCSEETKMKSYHGAGCYDVTYYGIKVTAC